MSETVLGADGQTLYAPVLSCRPVNPDDYPPMRQERWNLIVSQLSVEPPIYPGSTFVPCEDCQIEVALGPRQQEAASVAAQVGLLVHIVCHLCAPGRVKTEVQLMDLGNPFMRKKP